MADEIEGFKRQNSDEWIKYARETQEREKLQNELVAQGIPLYEAVLRTVPRLWRQVETYDPEADSD